MAKRRPTKIAGLPVFTCPRRPGELRLTATTCATSHKMAQRAEEEAKVRLWECIDCPTGAKHLAALGGPKRPQTDSDLPESLLALLKYIRTRGRCTVIDAASHFARQRATVADQLAALAARGLIQRIDRGVAGSAAPHWEAAL